MVSSEENKVHKFLFYGGWGGEKIRSFSNSFFSTSRNSYENYFSNIFVFLKEKTTYRKMPLLILLHLTDINIAMTNMMKV